MGDPADMNYKQNRSIDGLIEGLREEQDPVGEDRFAPVLLSTVDRSPAPPLLLDRLDPAEHTILRTDRQDLPRPS